ncbi:hypothetical protein POM88_009589 [Heracleum sosnowskyi]|uniref:Uncharacterized protein n=1 Tax=Heracleum sosnowskyi TaxID=360622 RepID=A0AAD8J9P4_9APIA|nr:hypothetical protein POM88_009589 [Heracleum sosnowskyi]
MEARGIAAASQRARNQLRLVANKQSVGINEGLLNSVKMLQMREMGSKPDRCFSLISDGREKFQNIFLQEEYDTQYPTGLSATMVPFLERQTKMTGIYLDCQKSDCFLHFVMKSVYVQEERRPCLVEVGMNAQRSKKLLQNPYRIRALKEQAIGWRKHGEETDKSLADVMEKVYLPATTNSEVAFAGKKCIASCQLRSNLSWDEFDQDFNPFDFP